MMGAMMAELHLAAAWIFAGFILTDRLILRPAMGADALMPVYRRARRVLVPVALVLLLSGAGLYQAELTLKAALGLATLTLFFLCPFAAARLTPAMRTSYRWAVLLLLLLTLVIAQR